MTTVSLCNLDMLCTLHIGTVVIHTVITVHLLGTV